MSSRCMRLLSWQRYPRRAHCKENCVNFDFDIPEDIPNKKCKIVVDMVFDEAEWIFINPVRILN